MHELAITQSVVDMVVERTAGRQVSLVRLEVGGLSGVVPDAMEFCYELLISGTPLEGSTLGDRPDTRGGALPIMRTGLRPPRFDPPLPVRQCRG